MKEATLTAAQQERGENNEWDVSHPEWKRLLDSNDPSLIWKTINWKGELCKKNIETPSDEQFNVHFKNLTKFQQG